MTKKKKVTDKLCDAIISESRRNKSMIEDLGKEVLKDKVIDGVMPDKLIVATAIDNFKQISEDNKKPMAVVKDHHICYGTDTPLCEILPIGGRGLIAEWSMITCPECKMKMKK